MIDSCCLPSAEKETTENVRYCFVKLFVVLFALCYEIAERSVVKIVIRLDKRCILCTVLDVNSHWCFGVNTTDMNMCRIRRAAAVLFCFRFPRVFEELKMLAGLC